MAVTKPSEARNALASKVVDVIGRATRGRRHTVVDQTDSPELSTQDMAEYSGRWVTIRGGHVVAAADTYDELMDDPRRHSLDGALFVAPSAMKFF